MGLRRRLLRIAHSALLAAGPRIGGRAAEALGRRLSSDSRFNRARALENLRLFFPDRDAAWIARTALAAEANAVRAKGRDKLELPALPPEVFDRACIVTNGRLVDDARDAGRGIVVVSMHYGRHWAGPLWFSRKGMMASAFQKGDGRLPFAEETLSGGTLGAKDRGAGLRAVRALKAGGVVFVQLDAGTVTNPIVVDFLGQPTRVPATPVRLARAADAIILPAVAAEHPSGKDKISIRFWPGVDSREIPDDEPVERTMRRVLEPLEALIREDAAQWYGVHSAHRRLAPGARLPQT